MTDPAINNLLRWGVENSEASRNGNAPAQPRTELDPKALAAFFNGQISEEDQMKGAMAIIEDDSGKCTLEGKKTAFKDLELLLGSIDNANNLEPSGLWTRLVNLLQNEEAEIRKNAAWCCKTAVQNNPKGQERLLVIGAIPTLVRMATEDADTGVRDKAIRTISSAVRNYPPSLDAVLLHLPAEYKPEEKIDAGDMSSVDSLIDKLRAEA